MVEILYRYSYSFNPYRRKVEFKKNEFSHINFSCGLIFDFALYFYLTGVLPFMLNVMGGITCEVASIGLIYIYTGNIQVPEQP